MIRRPIVRSRRRPYRGSLSLVREATREGSELSRLLRGYALRLLPALRFTDEKLGYLLAVLEAEEREELWRSLVAFSDREGQPLALGDCPSPYDPCGLEMPINELAVRGKRNRVEAFVEAAIRELLLATPGLGVVKNEDLFITEESSATGIRLEPPRLRFPVMGAFSERIGLAEAEEEVLLFYFASESSRELGHLFEAVDAQVKPRFIAICVDLPETEVLAALSRSGTLRRKVLLVEEDRGGLTSVSVSPPLVDALCGIPGSLSHERFCARAERSPYLPTDYGFSELELALCRAALLPAAPGTLLLYGPPGTGKTEFARCFAASLGKEAWFLNPSESHEPRERQAALSFAAASLEASAQLLVVDEAESLLTPAERLFMPQGALSKSWINAFLEETEVPTIWIVNSVGGIDDSTKRRFGFALAFEPFGQAEREEAWLSLASELGMYLPGGRVGTLASDYPVNLAGISLALRLAEMAQGSNRLSDPVLRAILESQLRLSLGETPPRERPRDARFDPGLLEAAPDAGTVERALAAWEERREEGDRRGLCLLFSGPPGTGKTEFCRHLADLLGRGLVVRRGAELLDAYVGGTERRIAAAFREAERSGALLLVDEADGFLRERSGAARSWEVTQVNEFLSRMEAFSGILVCCTNLPASLDRASLRRFRVKVDFRPPGTEKLLRLIRLRFPSIVIPDEAELDLARLAGRLSPGDLAAVAERLELYGGEPPAWPALLGELEAELEHRRAGEPAEIGGRG